MKVLIARPREAGERLARRIAALGYDPVVAPMLEIVPHASSVHLPDDTSALLFTSANGIRAFARLHPERTTAVFAVGRATASAAREAGFEDVDSAEGDANALVDLVRRRLTPHSGRMIHIRGREVAGNPAGALRGFGFRVSERVVYAAEPVRTLPPSTLRAIREHQLGAALFFSARTVEVFAATLSDREREALGSALAIAIAPGVASTLSTIGFRKVETAAEPHEDSMIGCLVGSSRNMEQPPAETAP